MDARVVDERDTEWEKSLLDLRVIVSDDEGGVTAYDLDDTSFPDAHRWAISVTEGNSRRFSIAIRQVIDGKPGLMWLLGNSGPNQIHTQS